MAPFHAWFYDPVTRQGQIFNSADEVPEGWVDRLDGEPSAIGSKPRPAAMEKPVDDPTAMSRKEITEALKAGGISFSPTEKTEALSDLLKGKVMEVLAKRNIPFDANAPVRDLLAKLA